MGCVSLGCLAEHGHSVFGVDINEAKVSLINKGKATIVERDMDALVERITMFFESIGVSSADASSSSF